MREPNTRIRVAVMVPDNYYRLALISLIRDRSDLFDVTGIFSSLPELYIHLQNESVDSVITSCRGLGDSFQDWIDFYTYHKKTFKNIKTLIIDSTVALNIHCAFFLRAHELTAYLDRKSSIKDFTNYLIESVAYEHSPVMSGRVLFASNQLSVLESDVITYYLTGMSTELIAKKFNKTAKAISYYKRRAMRKIGVENDMELIYYAS